MNNYFQYEWTNDFKKLQYWGRQFINLKVSMETYAKTGDTHNITHRINKEKIPDWIQKIFSIELSHIQLFSAQPQTLGYLHKDGIDRFCAFNIPVMGAEWGVIEWSDAEYDERKFEDSFTYIRLLNTNNNDVIVSDAAYNRYPMLLNTNKWHRVNNEKNNQWRHVLSFRFQNNPSFETVLNSLDFKPLHMQEQHNLHHQL